MLYRNLVFLLILFIAINLWAVWALLGENEDKESNPVILQMYKINLYPKEAKIFANATLNLKKGDTILVLRNVCADLDTASLEIKTSPEVQLKKIEFRHKSLENPVATTQVKRWQDSLKIFQDSLEQVNINHLALQKEEEWLNANQTITGSQQTLTVDKIKEMTAFVRTRSVELQKEKRSYEQAIQKFQNKVEQFKGDIEKIQQSPDKSVPELLLHLQVSTNISNLLEINYLTKSAHWQPVYELRLKADTSAQLVYQAQIFQNTGLTWKDLKINVLTDTEQESLSIPQLPDFKIDLMMLKKDSLTKKDSLNNTSRKPVAEVKPEQNILVKSTINGSWEIEKNQSIAADEKIKVLDIKTINLKMAWVNLLMPQTGAKIWRALEIPNWLKLQTPIGHIKVLQNQQFKHELTQIPALDSTLLIAVQSTQSLDVNRALSGQNRAEQAENMIETWEYTLQIKPGKNDTLNVYLLENLPISLNPTIEMTWQANEKPVNLNNSSVLCWPLKLLPNETKKIKYQYSIKYPVNTSLITP
jgi:uncharacterized protein (TIGR02231 family)